MKKKPPKREESSLSFKKRQYEYIENPAKVNKNINKILLNVSPCIPIFGSKPKNKRKG